MLRSSASSRSAKSWLLWLALLVPAAAITGLCTFPISQHMARADDTQGSGDWSIKFGLCSSGFRANPGTSDNVYVTFQTAPDDDDEFAKVQSFRVNDSGLLNRTGNLGDRDATFKFNWPSSRLRPVEFLETLRVSKVGPNDLCLASLELKWRNDRVFFWTHTQTQDSATRLPAHPRTGPIILNDSGDAPGSFIRFTNKPSFMGTDNAGPMHRNGAFKMRACGSGTAQVDLTVAIYHDGLVDSVHVPASKVPAAGTEKTLFSLEPLAHANNIERVVITNVGDVKLCYTRLTMTGPVAPGRLDSETIWLSTNSERQLQPGAALSHSVDKMAFGCNPCVLSVGTAACSSGCSPVRPGFKLDLHPVHKQCASGSGSLGSDQNCNAVDNDCDGTPDDNYVGAALPPCGQGACFRTNAKVCVGGTEVSPQCSPGPTTGDDTDCDGVDDDCDGSKDEHFGSTPTSCGQGACARTGTFSCVNGVPVNSCVIPCSLPECKAAADECRVDHGGGCTSDNDCDRAMICIAGQCRYPICSDGVRGPGEAGIDCGGDCRACDTLEACALRCRPGEQSAPVPINLLRFFQATFQRSTPATYEHAGKLATRQPDELRWLTVDGKRLALIEGAGTNLVHASANFADTSWKATGATRTVEQNSHDAPDGTRTADVLKAPVTYARSAALGIALSGSAQPYTLSTWAKNVDSTSAGKARAWLLQQTVGSDVPTTFTAGSKATWPLSSAWQRFSMSASRTGGLWVAFSDQENWPTQGTNPMESWDFVAWGAQVEAFPFATSYIATVNGQATRAADTLTFAGNKVPEWIRSGAWQFDVAPQFASAEALTVPMVLYSFGAQHEARLSRQEGKTYLEVVSSGNVVQKRELTFAKGDILTLTFDSDSDNVTLSGAKTGDGVRPATGLSYPVPANTTAAALRIGGRLGGANEAYSALSELRSVSAATAQCLPNTLCKCGDGTVNPGEECDPRINPRCTALCTLADGPSTGSSNADCPIGQHLEADAGALYGLDWWLDVCVPDVCLTQRDQHSGTIHSPCGKAPCVPNCAAATCGASVPDGCGGVCEQTCQTGEQCGECAAGLTCGVDNGANFDKPGYADVCWDEKCPGDVPCGIAEPQCEGRECGSDGAGGTCGSCGAGQLCDLRAGRCVTETVGGVITVPPAETSEAGSLPGAASVSDSGSGGYRIPIEVAASRGLIPQLAFEYDSSRGNGYMGMGWSISSPWLSVISRCPSRKGAVRKLVELKDTDDMCLDGQLLVNLSELRSFPSALASRGVNNSHVDMVRTYRTQLDTHVLIFGVDRNNPDNSLDQAGVFDPEEWYIIDDASQLKTFGVGPGRLATADARGQNGSIAHTWALEAISNLRGDVSFIAYECIAGDRSTCSDHRLAGIEYGCSERDLVNGKCSGTAKGQWARRLVSFVYEDRPDTIDGFRLGAYAERNERLASVQVLGQLEPRTDLPTDGRSLPPAHIRTYRLAYGEPPPSEDPFHDAVGVASSLNEPSLLKSITLCAGNGETNQGCLTPTTFSYAIDEQRDPSQLGFPTVVPSEEVHAVGHLLPLDADGNGKTDWLRWEDDRTCLVRSIAAEESEGPLFAEQCSDLFAPAAGTTLTRNWAAFSLFSALPDKWTSFEPPRLVADVGDINGDEKQDLFAFNPRAKHFVVYFSTGTSFSTRRFPSRIARTSTSSTGPCST